jgi:hypothetical protein
VPKGVVVLVLARRRAQLVLERAQAAAVSVEADVMDRVRIARVRMARVRMVRLRMVRARIMRLRMARVRYVGEEQ